MGDPTTAPRRAFLQALHQEVDGELIRRRGGGRLLCCGRGAVWDTDVRINLFNQTGDTESGAPGQLELSVLPDELEGFVGWVADWISGREPHGPHALSTRWPPRGVPVLRANYLWTQDADRACTKACREEEELRGRRKLARAKVTAHHGPSPQKASTARR